MLSKKIKMIGLASMLSLGAVCGAVAVNEVAPEEIVAINTVHNLNAVIDANARTMKVNGSNQTVFNNSLPIMVETKGKNPSIKTTITFNKGYGNFDFSIQKISNIRLNISNGHSSIKWRLGDKKFPSHHSDATSITKSEVVFSNLQEFNQITQLEFNQSHVNKVATINFVTIEFTCKD